MHFKLTEKHMSIKKKHLWHFKQGIFHSSTPI